MSSSLSIFDISNLIAHKHSVFNHLPFYLVDKILLFLPLDRILLLSLSNYVSVRYYASSYLFKTIVLLNHKGWVSSEKTSINLNDLFRLDDDDFNRKFHTLSKKRNLQIIQSVVFIIKNEVEIRFPVFARLLNLLLSQNSNHLLQFNFSYHNFKILSNFFVLKYLKKILDLQRNHIKIENLQNSKNIKALDLNLFSLFLSFNKIRKIENLNDLVNLKYLDVVNNLIKESDHLQYLVNLRSFVALFNSLSNIRFLINNHNLTHLDLYKNKKFSDSINIHRFKNLKILDISSTLIRDFSIDFNQFNNLSNLSMDYSNLSNFPIPSNNNNNNDNGNGNFRSLKLLFKFINLEKLILNLNKLSEIGDELLALKNLVYLNLSSNSIKTFDREKLDCFKKLDHLNSNNNLLNHFEIDETSLNKLEVLNLSHNNISKIRFINKSKEIPARYLSRIKQINLNTIHFSENPITDSGNLRFYHVQFLEVDDQVYHDYMKRFFKSSVAEKQNKCNGVDGESNE
ncbi:leucine-rich repeat domain-containing protein [Ascoidea rubescens DSM 1968]|uniref:L domain-like protein n=1 Tax=Ascoidea rubescens DSM 1968 TaxID=1344418 RepID=A0A1D2VH55_9ASCO|nr:L domain-like protein [Ascoidea rubescens DSM 1968]ODV60966.1 L domain-like protein [Ascoidea rubescens DSM 1968]